MIETSFLIPTRSNAGRPFPKALERSLQARLMAEFNGWTVAGKVQGAWRNEQGAVMPDTSIRYIVAVETEADVDRVVQVVRWACEVFDQEAIYFAVTGTATIIARTG